MSVLLMESFRGIATSYATYRRTNYSGSVSVVADNGYNNGPSFRFPGHNGTANLIPSVNASIRLGASHLSTPTTYSGTFYVGVRVKCTSNTVASNGRLMLYLEQSGGRVGGLVVNSDRTLQLCRASSTRLGSASASAVDLTTDHFIEMSYYAHNSSGTASIRVDGVEVVSFSGDTLDTASAASLITLGGLGTSATDYTYYSDLYVLDNNGTSRNTFLGEIRSAILYPTGDSATHNSWTATPSGTKYTTIDETAALSASDYINTSTENNTQAFTFGTPTETGSVVATKMLVGCNFDSATPTDPNGVQSLVRVGGSDYTGPTLDFSGSTSVYYEPMYVVDNPDTSSNWTNSTIGSAEFGLKLVA